MATLIAFMLLSAGLLGILIFSSSIVPRYLLYCQDPASYGLTSFSTELWQVLIFLILIGLSWFLARNLDHMYTINASGTKLFGHTPTETGYIATKWICIIFFPVLPIASYEVFAKEDYGTQSRYAMKQLDKLFWPQIIQTALKGFLSLTGVVVFFTVLFNLNCFITISK